MFLPQFKCEGGDTMVTWGELISLLLLITAIINLVIIIKKQ